MKKTLIQLGLFVVIIALGFFVYESIMEPVRFNKEKKQREKVVIERLKDIRTSQFIYKQLSGAYAPNFDTLISFLKVAEIPVVKIIPDPNDTTYTITINDTVGYIKVADSLFGKRDNFNYTQLETVPFSGGELFIMQADTIVRGGVKVHVFEAKAPFTTFLKGMNEQAIINIIAKFEDIEKYPGLRVGSMTEPSTDGNWE
ncbi:MAG: hypothetical protein H8E34_06270 [Bacteroidetes bacterium]|nr:hypothetical protein [Bacteroidota bacterium]